MPPNIALLGADDPLGEAVCKLLSEQDLEVGEVFPLTLSESEGCVSVRGEELPLFDPDEFDWKRCDILVSLGRQPAAARFADQAAQFGVRVLGIGLGEANQGSQENGVSVALARVLAALRVEMPVESVSATVMLPVSLAGEAGVSELVGQTRALFAMEEAEPEVFPLRIAFNLIPQVGAVLENGQCRFEQETSAGIRGLLDAPGLPVSVTAVWSPLFYGAAATVQIRSGAPVAVERVRSSLSGHPGVTVMDTGMPGGVATPATDAQDCETVFVSRIRSGADSGHDVAMWLVIDMIRIEASGILARLENLIEHRANSMLT